MSGFSESDENLNGCHVLARYWVMTFSNFSTLNAHCTSNVAEVQHERVNKLVSILNSNPLPP